MFTVPHVPRSAGPRTVQVAAASEPALGLVPHFGGFGILNTGAALSAKGISIGHRIQLTCAQVRSDLGPRSSSSRPFGAHVPAGVVRPDCGLGAPGSTNTGGAIAPNLSSGTADESLDIKFTRGSKSLTLDAGRLVADGGTLTLEAKIGSGFVSLATCRPPAPAITVSGATLTSSKLVLTQAGARAIGHALGTSLSAGGVMSSRFGGNFIFKQADIVSGSAVLSASAALGTLTPTGNASNKSSGLTLPVVPRIIGLTINGQINGTLHYTGGFSFVHRGKTDTITNLSASLRGNVINNRVDAIYARVNGTEVELATAVQSFPGNPQDQGDSATEQDEESPLKLTAAAAKTLGPGFSFGEDLGSLELSSRVPG